VGDGVAKHVTMGTRFMSITFFAVIATLCHAQTLEELLGYGLPVVVVNTLNGEEPTAERIDHPSGCVGVGITNATKVPGHVRIYYPGDTENPVFDSGEYVEGESGMTFKLRGNTSALDAKKPFKIKLQKKADLLMRGDKRFNDKDWALLRPRGGKTFPCPVVTMAGNKVAEILKVTDWVPASMYVNLIVNDNFRGFYLLTETIKRNEKCRIDIDKETGFISELDPYWWNEDLYVESKFLLKNASAYKFTFKYPDSDDITEEQLGAFKEFLDLFDSSMGLGRYPQLIDVESCARWLLAHQLLGTLDSAGSNIFFIRRDNQSKLEMGPLWDFDSVFRVSGTWTSIMSVHYFRYMLRTSPNKLLAREMIRIWNSEKEQIMAEVTNFCDSLSGSELAQAFDRSITANYKRWYVNLDDMTTTVSKLRDWFPTRAEEIDSLLNTLNTVDGDFTYDPNLIFVGIKDNWGQDNQTSVQKVIQGRHLYIIQDGKTYSIDGRRINGRY